MVSAHRPRRRSKSRSRRRHSPWLQDATGNAVGTVSAEIPIGTAWCKIRQTVFDWTIRGFPFGVKTAKKLKLHEAHIITVTGKAFYDIAHAPADHSNRRTNPFGGFDARITCSL